MSDPSTLRFYVDADVLYRGATTDDPTSASHALLRISEYTLFEALTSPLAVRECRRNIADQEPAALPLFRELVQAAIDQVEEPDAAELSPHLNRADRKDVPHLVAALQHGCPYLTTFNLTDYEPGHPDVEVLEPGEILERARAHLTTL